MSDSFADAPVTITELRATRTGNAKDQTARDAVVSFLRDIDSGAIVAPEFVIICFARRNPEGGVLVNEHAGGPHSPLEAFGLLEQCKHRLLSGMAD